MSSHSQIIFTNCEVKTLLFLFSRIVKRHDEGDMKKDDLAKKMSFCCAEWKDEIFFQRQAHTKKEIIKGDLWENANVCMKAPSSEYF